MLQGSLRTNNPRVILGTRPPWQHGAPIDCDINIPFGTGLAEWEYNSAHRSKEACMAEMIIRPTMKFIYLGYVLVVADLWWSLQSSLLSTSNCQPGFRPP